MDTYEQAKEAREKRDSERFFNWLESIKPKHTEGHIQRGEAISIIKNYLSSEKDNLSSSAVDFPSCADAGFYIMLVEGLGRAVASKVDQWDTKGMFTKDVDKEIIWLKYVRKAIQEQINKLKDQGSK